MSIGSYGSVTAVISGQATARPPIACPWNQPFDPEASSLLCVVGQNIVAPKRRADFPSSVNLRDGKAGEDPGIGEVGLAQLDEPGIRDDAIGDDFLNGVLPSFRVEMAKGDPGVSPDVRQYGQEGSVPSGMGLLTRAFLNGCDHDGDLL